MANETVTKIPILIVETDATPANSVVTITAPLISELPITDEIIISVVVGTVKFSVGEAAVSGDNGYTSSDGRFILTVGHQAKLNFLAAAQNDSFLIEY